MCGDDLRSDKELHMFKIDKPSEKDLAFFVENGYVPFPGVLTAEGSQGLMDEVL